MIDKHQITLLKRYWFRNTLGILNELRRRAKTSNSLPSGTPTPSLLHSRSLIKELKQRCYDVLRCFRRPRENVFPLCKVPVWSSVFLRRFASFCVCWTPLPSPRRTPIPPTCRSYWLRRPRLRPYFVASSPPLPSHPSVSHISITPLPTTRTF